MFAPKLVHHYKVDTPSGDIGIFLRLLNGFQFLLKLLYGGNFCSLLSVDYKLRISQRNEDFVKLVFQLPAVYDNKDHRIAVVIFSIKLLRQKDDFPSLSRTLPVPHESAVFTSTVKVILYPLKDPVNRVILHIAGYNLFNAPLGGLEKGKVFNQIG